MDAMEVFQIVGIVLGSSGFVAFINYLSDRRKRKDVLEDKSDDTDEKINDLKEETEERFKKVDEQFSEFHTVLNKVSENTTLVMKNAKAQSYDRIRHLALSYIKAGKIYTSEAKNLVDMYEAYSALEYDSFLELLMQNVKKLQIIPDSNYESSVDIEKMANEYGRSEESEDEI